MHARCIEAVNAAAGRTLSANEIKRIEERLQGTMRRLAISEDGWQSLSTDQRLSMAAERAMADIQAEAQRKVVNAQLQIVKTAALEARLQRLMEARNPGGNVLASGAPRMSRSRALAEELDQTRTLVEAEKVQSLGRMMALMDAAKSGDGVGFGRRVAMFLFDADNPHMTRDLVNEIFAKGEAATDNAVAKEGAKAWLRTIEELRQRFNAAGGDVRQLEYGYLPQPHDSARVRAVGAETYASKVLSLVDRSRYVHENGSRMADAEVLGVLRAAHETIATEGMNKQQPGAFQGSGARANRGNDARVIHFKDGDAWLQYMAEFGRGNMYDAMLGHIGGITRSISLVERYGPNPNAQMKLQFDLAARADGGLGKMGVGVGQMRVDPKGMWEVLSGATSTPHNDLWAAGGQMLRNIQIMGKLAGTVVKSLPDVATYFLTTGYNRLPYWDAIANLKRVATDAEARQFLGMHGLMASSATDMLNVWSAENIRQTWSGRLANATMRLSLMNAWNDWLNRAFGMTKMHGLGNMAGTPWEGLKQWDRELLTRRGVTADDWSVVNRAEPSELHGMKFLTPDSIVATGHERGVEIATKVLALVRDETQYAVIQPDLMTQAARTWNGTQAGTGLGELARSLMLFKGFPFAMITRHWKRMADMPVVTDGSAPIMANRGVYIGGLVVAGTALGAISTQAWQILWGKDPIDMIGPHAAKFWLQAFAVGGGGGFYSDLIMRDSTQDRGAWDAVGKTLGGPVIGDIADLVSLTKQNIDQKLAGKETHFGAEALKFGRSHVPFVNLWYARAAIDHFVMNSLSENLSPGYLSKMQARAQKEWGQGFWWAPAQAAPGRAPNLAAAIGSP